MPSEHICLLAGIDEGTVIFGVVAVRKGAGKFAHDLVPVVRRLCCVYGCTDGGLGGCC